MKQGVKSEILEMIPKSGDEINGYTAWVKLENVSHVEIFKVIEGLEKEKQIKKTESGNFHTMLVRLRHTTITRI